MLPLLLVPSWALAIDPFLVADPPGAGVRGNSRAAVRAHSAHSAAAVRKKHIFHSKTTYSNRRFDIVDPDKWLTLYLFLICPSYIE